MARYIETAKKNYIERLLLNGDIEASHYKQTLALYAPLFEPRPIHAEDEPYLKDYNTNITECLQDISILNVELQTAALEYTALVDSIMLRLQALKTSLESEKTLEQDINLLCNQYSCFEDVISIQNHIETGNYSYKDGIFSAQVVDTTPVTPQVIDVVGNGYEGNHYVIENNKMLSETLKTDNRAYLIDNSNLTVYEYSRITVDYSEKDAMAIVHNDQLNPRCVITLKTDVPCNKIIIKSPITQITLNDLLISEDGVTYQSILEAPIALDENMTTTVNYINHSGLLCFPTTHYIKLNLESYYHTDEKIGFYKTVVTNKTKEESHFVNISTQEETTPDWYTKYELIGD